MTREGRNGENLRDDETRWPPAETGAPPDGYGPAAAADGGHVPPDSYGPPGYPGQPPEPGYGSQPRQGSYPGQGGYPDYGSQPGWAGQQGGSHPGAAEPYYGPQDPYSIPDPYAPQDRYPAQDPYGTRDATAPPGPYPPDPYGPPAPRTAGDPNAGPDPYRSAPPYAGPDPYAPPGSASSPGQDRPGRAGGYGPRDPFGGRDPLDTSVPFVPDTYGDQPQRPGSPGGQRSGYGEPGPYGPYGQADSPVARDPYGQTDPSGGRAAYGQPGPAGSEAYGVTDPGGRDPYRDAAPPGLPESQHPGDRYGTADPYRPADPYGSTTGYQQPPDFGGYYPGGPGQPPDSRPQAAAAPGHDPRSFPQAGAGQQGTDPAAGRPGGPFRWMPPASPPGPGDDSPDYLRGQGAAGYPAGDYGPPGYAQPGGPEPLQRPPGYEGAAAGPGGYGGAGEPYPAWHAGQDPGNGMGYGGDPRYAAGGGPPYPAAGDPGHPGGGDPRYPAPGAGGRGAGPRAGRGPGQRPARDQARGPGGLAKAGQGRPGRNAARGPAGGGAVPGADRPPKKRRSGTLAGLAAVIIIVVVLAAGGIAGYRYIQGKLHPANYSGAGQGTVLVQVQSGDSAITLAPRLLRLGVIASTAAFIAAVKASSNPTGLEPGTFRLHKHMNAAVAYQLLLSPKSRVQAKVVIREGLRVSQVVAALAKNTRFKLVAYSEALRSAATLGLPSFANGNPEGYLFPATYTIQPDETPQQILQAMTARFRQEAQSINLPVAAKAAVLSQSHVIIVASLIQAEAGQVSDFPKIARVIYNRLNSGMKLQLDSTVFYALGTYGIQATSADLKTNSPYNTYRHAGLPPTPIDSPGDAAIKAALHPAHGDWLYFVTVDPKKHITKFTASETQFQRFRAELARNLRANR